MENTFNDEAGNQAKAPQTLSKLRGTANSTDPIGPRLETGTQGCAQ